MNKNKTDKFKMPELLAPAGNFEKLVTAIHYGADAVYMGGKQFSLRAHATNFSDSELEQAIGYARARSIKAYVTVNIMAHDRDLKDIEEYLVLLQDIKADGLIVSDPGVLLMAKQLVPDLPVHLSTQANVTNPASAMFWQQQGVSRINIARELSIAELTAIKKALDIEVEVFVHGAVCISYSGRCLLSYYLTGRDANHGDCAHPCRYGYTLLEEKRPGQFFPVEEDGRGTYIFNAKDACLLNRLPELIDAGADSFKIEGRMKGIYYVGGVLRVYRAALDYLAAARSAGDPEPTLPAAYMQELAKVGTRGFSEGFADGPPGAGDMIYNTPRLEQSHLLAGVIRHPDPVIEVRNTLQRGERLEYLGRGLDSFSFIVEDMFSLEGEALAQANPGDQIRIKTGPSASGWETDSLLRKKTNFIPDEI